MNATDKTFCPMPGCYDRFGEPRALARHMAREHGVTLFDGADAVITSAARDPHQSVQDAATAIRECERELTAAKHEVARFKRIVFSLVATGALGMVMVIFGGFIGDVVPALGNTSGSLFGLGLGLMIICAIAAAWFTVWTYLDRNIFQDRDRAEHALFKAKANHEDLVEAENEDLLARSGLTSGDKPQRPSLGR